VTNEQHNALLSFAAEIGWKNSILQTPADPGDSWLERLLELSEIYQRPALWSNDAFGNIEYQENGERWIAKFRTFRDPPKIWRVYERIHFNPERPNFAIDRRSAELIWERMGYFDKWPSCWAKH
jgi:hypothetical protein